ncbi:DNA circularization protein [Agarivorans sp. B2Z047]|uniref:DNA circularization protein n=1 Tax=Agarivorans sp. B2Z047 TaxID=2652721 RepID=UPI0018839FD1|nr:DNA circularization N-terminal domain-containing protein [Agarivorans sp. B2Z047]UQN43745.1 DNA circularization N-terminal domain-containing protein [Agarivorans sp. B2Z047]
MSNWYDLQNASFRGVVFKDKTIGGKSGRRVIAHQYPKSERGWTEDNGAVLSNFNIEAIVIGDNYRNDLSRLLTALNAPGPGMLVHPHFGERTIQIGEVNHKLITNHGGYAEINFECFDAGRQSAPVSTQSTEVVLQSSVDDGLKQVNNDFENEFDTTMLPDYDQEDLAEQGKGFVDDMAEFYRQMSDPASNLGDVLDQAEQFKTRIGELLAKPGELAREYANLLSRAEDLATRAPEELQAYGQLKRRYEGKCYEYEARGGVYNNRTSNSIAAVPGTVLEIKQRRHVELSSLLEAQVALFSAGTVPRTTFADAKSAEKASDSIDTNLNIQAITASNLGRAGSWQALRDASVQVRTDINQRALLLPRIRTITTTTTEPLILIAYRETGDAKRRDDIIRRNGIKNPSFIMPGTNLEIVNE